MNRRETALKIQATMCAARVNANGRRNGGGHCHFYIIHTQTNAVILIHAHFSTDVFVPKMFASNACAWWTDLVVFTIFPTIRYFTPLFWQMRNSVFYSTTLSGLDGFKLIFWSITRYWNARKWNNFYGFGSFEGKFRMFIWIWGIFRDDLVGFW